MKFTDRTIANLKPKAGRYELFESRTGLGVRVNHTGSRVFIHMFKFQGRSRRATLGKYPAISLAQARVDLATQKELLAKGEDPGIALVGKRRAERSAETVAVLVDEYLVRWARPNKRSAAEDERMLRKDVLPAWGHLKARDISRRDVTALLDAVVDRGSPISANRLLACVRRMFRFAVERGILDSSPCSFVRAPSPENTRSRVLDDTEVKAFWHGLDRARMDDGIRKALRFMLVTGQRKSEVTNARWDEFDIEKELWVIPASRAKNGREHHVPLSAIALGQLREIGERESGWLFPSSRTGAPYRGQSVDHALRLNLERIGVTNMTPHDLRRSAATHMRELGIARTDVAMVLNHVVADATAAYDKYTGEPEKRRALEIWGARLAEIIAGKPAENNVVSMRSA